MSFQLLYLKRSLPLCSLPYKLSRSSFCDVIMLWQQLIIGRKCGGDQREHSGMEIVVESGVEEHVGNDEGIFGQRKQCVDPRLTVVIVAIEEICGHQEGAN